MINSKLNQIFEKLDKWVSVHGTGNYVHKNFYENPDNNYNLSENFGIQQVRQEIFNFSKEILKRKNRGICAEIGLGFYGSTHFLWRHIFKKVITIEYQMDRIFAFRENLNKFYLKPALNDNKSKFVFGKSSDPASIKKLFNILGNKKLDMLFIDGDHNFEGVYADYHIYSSFVKRGGIIAFHDCLNNISGKGVYKFIKEIQKTNNKIKFKKIVHSKSLGIAYIIK